MNYYYLVSSIFCACFCVVMGILNTSRPYPYDLGTIITVCMAMLILVIIISTLKITREMKKLKP
jgi:uncharacterized protein YhhL (DUF1145 family)